jgi:hypothetical protein
MFVEASNTTIYIKDRNSELPPHERRDTIIIRTDGENHTWRGPASSFIDVEGHLAALGFEIVAEAPPEEKEKCGKCGYEVEKGTLGFPNCGHTEKDFATLFVLFSAVGLAACAWAMSVKSWLWKTVAIVIAALVLLPTLITLVNVIRVKWKVRSLSRVKLVATFAFVVGGLPVLCVRLADVLGYRMMFIGVAAIILGCVFFWLKLCNWLEP